MVYGHHILTIDMIIIDKQCHCFEESIILMIEYNLKTKSNRIKITYVIVSHLDHE